ncbi:MAG: hypothetical protein AMJ92_09515 [candidate division Zixibacteria bacterium SM23_81]|nr:MAG: hypothetical protein AMJ92_09515 [candidate division Zixibacteria bacterium SM23_81]
MIVACHQPYFMPWPGFFAKAMKADLLVLLDNVQFPLGSSWMSRNRIKTKDGQLWISVPVLRKGRGLQQIDRVEIFNERDWGKRHCQRLEYAYHHAPYFPDHRAFFEEVFRKEWTYLVKLNLAILNYLRSALEIETPFQLNSELEMNTKGTQLLVDICQKLGAHVYLSSSPGKKFLDEKMFQQAGLDIKYFHYRPPAYPQLWGPFLPNLSVVDLLFNCGPKSRQIIDAC